MENEEFKNLNQVEISPETLKEIEKKVAEIKAKDAKLRIVFPILVKGADYDEKDLYVGFFRQPTFMAFSKYLSAMQKDAAIAMRTLARDCFLEGDKELIDDDSLFVFGLMSQLNKIIEARQGSLLNLSKPGK